MVDSVKVYYKSKASFNWPEEVLKEPVVAPAGTSGAVALVDAQSQAPSKHLHTPFDRLLMHSLELLDECLVFSDPFLLLPLKQPLLDLTTRLLSLPTPDSLHQQAKSLMSSLFSSKTAYYWHKVLMFVYSVVCSFGCLFVWLVGCLFVWLFVYLFYCLFGLLFVCLFVCLFVWLGVCLFACYG